MFPCAFSISDLSLHTIVIIGVLDFLQKRKIKRTGHTKHLNILLLSFIKYATLVSNISSTIWYNYELWVIEFVYVSLLANPSFRPQKLMEFINQSKSWIATCLYALFDFLLFLQEE